MYPITTITYNLATVYLFCCTEAFKFITDRNLSKFGCSAEQKRDKTIKTTVNLDLRPLKHWSIINIFFKKMVHKQANLMQCVVGKISLIDNMTPKTNYQYTNRNIGYTYEIPFLCDPFISLK